MILSRTVDQDWEAMFTGNSWERRVGVLEEITLSPKLFPGWWDHVTIISLNEAQGVSCARAGDGLGRMVVLI